MRKRNLKLIEEIKKASDGKLFSRQIAEQLGCTAKYVQAIQLEFDLPRKKQAPPNGVEHPGWKGGRVVDRDGYVLVTAPLGHPHARVAKGRNFGRILEHRLLMEEKLGRYLLPTEVVDHVDGNRLNNDPENLRLFASNGGHLKETLTGRVPKWSSRGKKKLRSLSHKGRSGFLSQKSPRIDTYLERKRSHEIRRQVIETALEKLGKDSPHLLGLQRYISEVSDQKAPSKEQKSAA